MTNKVNGPLKMARKVQRGTYSGKEDQRPSLQVARKVSRAAWRKVNGLSVIGGKEEDERSSFDRYTKRESRLPSIGDTPKKSLCILYIVTFCEQV